MADKSFSFVQLKDKKLQEGLIGFIEGKLKEKGRVEIEIKGENIEEKIIGIFRWGMNLIDNNNISIHITIVKTDRGIKIVFINRSFVGFCPKRWAREV